MDFLIGGKTSFCQLRLEGLVPCLRRLTRSGEQGESACHEQCSLLSRDGGALLLAAKTEIAGAAQNRNKYQTEAGGRLAAVVSGVKSKRLYPALLMARAPINVYLVNGMVAVRSQICVNRTSSFLARPNAGRHLDRRGLEGNPIFSCLS
jgi:hypothetical protein